MDEQTNKKMRIAIQQNRVDDFKRLASENGDFLEDVTFWGNFLHYAANFGNYEIAKFLIEQGIDVNKKCGYRNSTALAPAAYYGYLDIVKLLYENGCKLYVDTFKENPLFAAIAEGHLDVVKFLVEKGIDLSPRYDIDGTKMDACEYAGHCEKNEILGYLDEHLGRKPSEDEEPEEATKELSEKPEFDYEAFGEKLFEEMRKVLKKYSDREDIYAFSIKYEPELTTFIDILANTYSKVNECFENGSGRFGFNDYKYNEEDWEIWEELEELSNDLVTHYDLVEEWCGDDDDLYEDMHEEHKSKIIDTCVNVMQKIRKTEEFSLYPKLNLNVYVREGMSDEEELEIFKKLNDEQAVEEYEKFLFG
ncbi:protein of unknown function [Butyrivibrio sp. ob235]|uniref:ankyrin repeat domain-containing protein n=1 Tax=Butyrivibrio sp. ob235 TaxID=1761780 RepID=UPI0008B9CA96|nr:ankyrin repeat domain-containing protein [Butyrivibrio sp. ob235]SEL85351.1 protein of unknown function [Butyrivibrio sp. ob235]